jgi:hypothetical protein
MWDSPNAQRALLARGTLGYKKTPEEVAVARVKQGYEVVHLPSVSPDKVRFWRKRGGGLFS